MFTNLSMKAGCGRISLLGEPPALMLLEINALSSSHPSETISAQARRATRGGTFAAHGWSTREAERT
jgi:hypothetical protein